MVDISTSEPSSNDISVEPSNATTLTTDGNAKGHEDYDIFGFTEGDKIALAVYSALSSICAFIAIFGNAIAMIVLFRNRKRALQQIYLLNLTISDFFVGLLVLLPYSVYSGSYLTVPFSHAACVGIHLCDVIMTGASSLTMVLISYDRFLLVTAGAQYSSKESLTKVVVKIVISWVIACLCGAPSYIWFKSSSDITCLLEYPTDLFFTLSGVVLFFAITFLLILAFNARVYWYFIRKEKQAKVAPAVASSRPTHQEHSGAQSGSSVEQSNMAAAKIKKNRAAARFMGILVLVYVITWAPICFVMAFASFEVFAIDLIPFMYLLLIVLGNSALNPILYITTNPVFRQDCNHLVTKIFCK